MSWDIVLLNSKQKIDTIDEIDEEQLTPIDFCSKLNNHFQETNWADSTVDYYGDDEETSNAIIHVYSEKGFYELVVLAKENNWQLFDTALGEMVDLENPSKNGFEQFQGYRNYVLNNVGKETKVQNKDKPWWKIW